MIQGLLIFMHDLRKYKIKTQLTVKFFLFTVCEPSSFVPFCDVLVLLFETPSPLPPPPPLYHPLLCCEHCGKAVELEVMQGIVLSVHTVKSNCMIVN